MAVDAAIVISLLNEVAVLTNKLLSNAQDAKKIKKEEADAIRKDLRGARKAGDHNRIFVIARRVRRL